MSETIRVEKARMLEIQRELSELAGKLFLLHATVIQMAAETPGGNEMDVHGHKPRAKAMRPAPSPSATSAPSAMNPPEALGPARQ